MEFERDKRRNTTTVTHFWGTTGNRDAQRGLSAIDKWNYIFLTDFLPSKVERETALRNLKDLRNKCQEFSVGFQRAL